jgi:ABC-2 type transport system permease protein
MNMKRVAAVAQKEWREIVRDKLFFSLAFIVPVVLMLMFGYGLSLDVENIPMAIVDHDGTASSRDYANKFIDSRYFHFLGYAHDERELTPLLTDNRIRAAVIIPEYFEKNLLSGRPAQVQTLIDGTFPFRAQTTKGYIIAINSAVSAELLTEYLSRLRGIPHSEARQIVQPIRLEVRYLYNQSVKSIWSLAPKLLMVILMISPPFLTALGIVREKESGSIYNIYSSTLSRGEFLIGKLAPYVGISILNAIILWSLAVWLYEVPFKGSLLFFFPATVMYVICTTGIGLVVSVLVSTQTAAMIVTAIFTIVPAVLYSGILIPISSLTKAAQVIAHALPAMYYTNIALGCFLKGVGFAALWFELLILGLYATILFTIGYLMFNKRPKI